MMKDHLKYGLIVAFLFISNVLFAQTDMVEFNTDTWILGDKTEIVQFAGRTALKGNGYLKDVQMLNGTVEVDFITTGERSFGGIMFRVQSFQEYEWCWLRMHKTNGIVRDGVQYAPVFNSIACWQLNGGKDAMRPVDVPKNEWVHMKIELLNDTAKLYVKDMTKPVMIMDNLQLGLKKGSVGILASYNNNIHFSNFTYWIDENSATGAPSEKHAPAQCISEWQLSPRYKIEKFIEIETYPADKLSEIENWIMPDVETTGLVNITKYHGRDYGKPDCAILRTYIDSDKDKLVKMNFGYSDAAAVFLNQQPLFRGNRAYRSRNMAFGGWISYNDAVFLNLKKGRNELLVVVAEVFGGWGFQAKLDDIEGIEFK